jgi:hypothetical protein
MEIGTGWVEDDSGVEKVVSNRAVQTISDTAWHSIKAEGNTPNPAISIKVVIPTELYYARWFQFRRQDVSHKWYLSIERDGVGALAYLSLFRDGADVGGGNQFITTVAGTTYTIVINANGNEIYIYLDGIQKFHVTNATYNDKTQIGMNSLIGTGYVPLPVDEISIV